MLILLINPQYKYRRVVRAKSDELILQNRNWKFMEDNQGTIRAAASEVRCKNVFTKFFLKKDSYSPFIMTAREN